MLRDGPLDIAMVDVPDGFPVHRTMSETAGGFAYTDMRVVGDDGTDVPDGAVGELLIRGIGVMAGYNKRERWETFDADGWYHTGDRVYRRDGDPRLFYIGRTTDLIKAAGANVSPLEVEAVISEFADVAQCLVLGVDDPARGEEVCAVVAPPARTSMSPRWPHAPALRCRPTRCRRAGSSPPATGCPPCPAGSSIERRCIA